MTMIQPSRCRWLAKSAIIFKHACHARRPSCSTRDEARRIAANIAKLDLLGRGAAASPDHLPGLFGGGSPSVTRSNRRKQGGTVPRSK